MPLAHQLAMLLTLFCSHTVLIAKDLDVLILSPQSDTSGSRLRTGFDAVKTAQYLDAMLKASPTFTGSTCTLHTEDDVDSLLELHYDTRYRATTASVIKSDYDVVVMAPYYPYLRWAPEFCFEASLQLSKEILAAGARPIFLMSVGDGNGDSGPVGQNAYRVANGCGVEVNPAGYALLDRGLFVRSLGEQQAYIIAASLYTQITGLSASQLDYSPVTESAVLADVAFDFFNNHKETEHYVGSRHNSGMVRYRSLDVSGSPFNGTVRYAYVGTSTEAGINSHLQPIIQANGWTAASQFVSSNGGNSKYWTDTDFDLAKPYFDENDEKVLFTYARGTTSGGNQMIAYDQGNLLPIVFDRHRDNVGSGSNSSLEMLEDIEIGSWYDYYYQRNYQWSSVPFHIGATRVYHTDNSVIVSSDGVHVTTPFYNLIASMMLTSALGQNIQPTTTIQNNAQSLAAFNIGKQVVKQLAYLSEDERFIPDSQLQVATEKLAVATTSHTYNHVFAATGGTAPYSWEVVSGDPLPAGLILSVDGVLSGIPTGGVGTHVIVCKVMDSNGAIRKKALRLLVQDHSDPSFSNWAEFMFDDSGVAEADRVEEGDPDLDGKTNFLEYALASDPAELNAQQVSFSVGEDAGVFKFMRGQSHCVYSIQSSADLVDWTDTVWDSVTDVSSLVDVGAEQEVALGALDQARFYRLAVTE